VIEQPIATVTERNGRTTTGELVYEYSYPHAVTDKHGNVERFERRPQRVCLRTDAGVLTHFTVPARVERNG